MRVTLEFQCTECRWFNYPSLRDNMNGNYTIVCGNCQHRHHRVVVNGQVTEDRHSSRFGGVEIVHVMKSATQQERRKLGVVAQLRQKMVAGLMS